MGPNSEATIRHVKAIAILGAALLVGFAVWSWNRDDKLAGFAIAQAAASSRGCRLGTDAIDKLVAQYRDRDRIGWAESGSAAAASIEKNCGGTPPHAPTSP